MNTIDIGNEFFIGKFEKPIRCKDCNNFTTVEVIALTLSGSYHLAKQFTGTGTVRCISCSISLWGKSLPYEAIKNYLKDHPEIALEA